MCAEQKLRIVVSFSILEDLIKVLTNGIQEVEIKTIVPRDADPHTYQPVPSDSIKTAKADLVFVNGLGFEEWIDKLIEGSGFEGKIITLSQKVECRKNLMDPHVWHDVQKYIRYVENALHALCERDPVNASKYKKNAKAYKVQLQKLDQWIQEIIQKIKIDKRIVITTHDAFWYFGDRYHVKFLSPVGISTDAEPSPRAVSKLIRQIKEKNIHAIFFENLTMHRKLLTQISNETGRSISCVLYADALSNSDGPAATYIQMITHNVITIMNALMGRK